MITNELLAFFWSHFSLILKRRNIFKINKMGRPQANLKIIFMIIMETLWHGYTWRRTPNKRYKKSTVHKYHLEWAQMGLYTELWKTVALEALTFEGMDVSFQIIDGSDIKISSFPKEDADHGYKYPSKRAIKLTIIINADGMPVSLDICKASIHDSQRVEPALENEIISLKDVDSTVLLADKGYVGQPVKEIGETYGKDIVCPAKINATEDNTPEEKKLLANRYKIENCFEKLFNLKRISFPLDKTIAAFQGWCSLGCAVLICKSIMY
jgi:transposase